MLLIDELREAWRDESRDHRVALVSLAVITVVLRLLYMGQPMRYDEAVTYMYFVRHPWQEALSSYLYPNNHLFHTALAKIAVAVFGGSPWALRIPAFIAGVLVVAATYAVARTLYGSRAALMAAAITGSSGVLTSYSTNARGYSIVVLAYLLLVLVAARLVRGDRQSLWFTFALIAAAGLWTIPVMLYPLGAVSMWFALSALVDGKRAEVRRLAIALGLAGTLALVAYTPVISNAGIGVITRNRFVAPSGWFEFFSQLPGSFLGAMRDWTIGIHPLVSVALLVCAVIGLRRHSRLSPFGISLALTAYVWCAWLLVVTHRSPFSRVWLWLVPVAAMLAGAGLVSLLEGFQRTSAVAEKRLPMVSVALSFAMAVSVAASFAIPRSRDTGTYRDAEAAAAVLSTALRPGDRVVARIPSNGPLAYYMHRAGLDSAYLTLNPTRARRVILVVDSAEGQSLDRMVANSPLRDSTQYTRPALLAALPSSRLVVFERRNAETR